MDLTLLRPAAAILAAAVVLDLVLGDPTYAAHPIRLVGKTIIFLEYRLRALGFDGLVGGIVLFLGAAFFWCAVSAVALLIVDRISHRVAVALLCYFLYSMLALRSLIDHVWAVEVAARRADVLCARYSASRLVGRDTGHLSIEECRRAAIESLSENLTDGYLSPLFWYAVGGLLGVVLFKVVSTLDSMVGNKSARYIRFGKWSARADDALNWIPARLCWLLIAAIAAFIPRCSAGKALSIGWRQHALLPSPNSGWSEAATAGAIQMRLVGPIRRQGVLVTDLWLGYHGDPPAGRNPTDVTLAITLLGATGPTAAALFTGAIIVLNRMLALM